MRKPQIGDRLQFPYTVAILISASEGEVTAHNLHFDLVCAASTRKEVEAQIRLCTKHYVEFGLEHDLSENIIKPAEDKYWGMAEEATPVFSSESIRIETRRTEPARDGSLSTLVPREVIYAHLAA